MFVGLPLVHPAGGHTEWYSAGQRELHIDEAVAIRPSGRICQCGKPHWHRGRVVLGQQSLWGSRIRPPVLIWEQCLKPVDLPGRARERGVPSR